MLVGMEEEDRQNITRNLSRLVEQTNIDVLLPKLLEKGVFTSLMVERYLPGTNLNDRERKTNLYLDLQRRGPTAFQKLIDSLTETEQYQLAKLLQPNFNLIHPNREESVARDALPSSSHHSGSSLSNLPAYYSSELQNKIAELTVTHPNAAINLNMEPLRVTVKHGSSRLDRQPSKPQLSVYSMGSRPKGYFLMINNIKFINNVHEERFGAEVDDQNLKTLFQELGYEVISYRDLKFTEMQKHIREFAQMREHKSVHSCVVAIMSHGFSGEEPGSTDFSAVDGLKLSSNWVLECFNNYHCSNLMGRPKIFFFQTCRGKSEDYGVQPVQRHSLPVQRHSQRPRVVNDGFPASQIRTYSDMLIAYSTLPGYVSNRDTNCGTWYIQTICKIFMEHAHDTEIQDMLTMVDNKIKHLVAENGTMQTSTFENRGFQKFFFNPGLYDDNSSSDQVPENSD